MAANEQTCNGEGDDCQLGACCLPDGSCEIMVGYWCTNVEGGVFNGSDTTCADVDECAEATLKERAR